MAVHGRREFCRSKQNVPKSSKFAGKGEIRRDCMATAISKELDTLREKVARFAEQEVACRPDLYTGDRFPHDIWRKMGRERLLGISLPVPYGGLGGNYLTLVATAEAFVARGHNMGLAVSWLIHHAVARFLILGFGNENQKEELLPGMAEGRLTACIAVSEPGTGAHPKHLKTTAFPDGDLYVLNGEKAFLTNGPIADLFVVFAQTGDDGGRKHFTAFLIPKGTPGLTVTRPLDLDFLRPSPHCGINLEDCKVPASVILGKKGSAYQDMVKPFRELEDVLMMGPVLGAMERQIEVLIDLIRKQGLSLSDELKERLGLLQSLINLLRINAYEAAAMLDSRERHPEFLSLMLASRAISSDAQSLLERFITEAGIKIDPASGHITHDINRTIQIAKNVARIKQRKLGEGLLV
jgi:alkylation response protein AidB-like acyl-CoA dehydrogenase